MTSTAANRTAPSLRQPSISKTFVGVKSHLRWATRSCCRGATESPRFDGALAGNSCMILRIFHPADQQHIREVVEKIGAEDAALLPSLGVGEALLSGQFIGTAVLAKVEPGRATSAREEDDLIGRLYE